MVSKDKVKEADCPECRVCHHRHCSWFEDSEGIICDWCLNDIPCPDNDTLAQEISEIKE